MIRSGKWISFNLEIDFFEHCKRVIVAEEIRFSHNFLYGYFVFSGRKTNLLPDPGYVALTNICLEDGGCCPVKKDPPGHSSKNHVKIPSKKCRPSLLLRCSPVSISTLKNDLFCFVRVNSVAFSAPLLRWRKIPKYRALHVTDCNSVFVAELLEIQIETINVNEERSL